MPVARKKIYRRPAKKQTMRTIAKAEARKALKRELEVKYSDSNASSQAIDAATGYFYELTQNLAKGTGAENAYVGTKISPRYLEVRGTITGADGYNYVRLLLIQSKTANPPTISSIFDLSGSITAPFSFLNRDYTSTYKTLGSRLIKTVDGSDVAVRPFVFRISTKKLSPVHFLTGSSPRTAGLLWICAVSDSTTVAHPTITFQARLSYTDA